MAGTAEAIIIQRRTQRISLHQQCLRDGTACNSNSVKIVTIAIIMSMLVYLSVLHSNVQELYARA